MNYDTMPPHKTSRSISTSRGELLHRGVSWSISGSQSSRLSRRFDCPTWTAYGCFHDRAVLVRANTPTTTVRMTLRTASISSRRLPRTMARLLRTTVGWRPPARTVPTFVAFHSGRGVCVCVIRGGVPARGKRVLATRDVGATRGTYWRERTDRHFVALQPTEPVHRIYPSKPGEEREERRLLTARARRH